MRKSLMMLTAATAVGIGGLFGDMAGKSEAAGNISNLTSQQQQVEKQRAQLNSSINVADKKIANLQGKQVDVKTAMKQIDLSIGNTNANIRGKTVKVNVTNAQISKLEADVKVIQGRIAKRNELLKSRARNYQENGSVNYISVLMGSKSFSDFIDRANAVAAIVQADQGILKQAEADEQELEQKQTQVKTELAHLQSYLSDLKNMKQQLSTQKAEKNKLLSLLQAKEKKVSEDKMSLQERNQILATQGAAIKKAIQLEQSRQAELARQAKAASAAKTAAGSSSNSNSNSNSSGGTVTAPSSSSPAVSSGNFTRPAAGVISSGFGQRWGAFHPGVDIANGGSNVPIVAAADGVVIRSYYSSSYGNCIFIAHSINGQVYTTVYAHMESRLVGNGASVLKGQQIGIMGSTGQSTGQHLHFELHRGSWNYAKTNAINPVGIVF